MGFNVDALIWDAENEAHIWVRHHLAPEEVEEAVIQRLKLDQAPNGRVLVWGETFEGKKLLVVLAPGFSETTWYVVTARPANKKELQDNYGGR